MKRGFELLMIVAAIFLAVFVGRSWWSRGGLSERQKIDQSLRPGLDAAPGDDRSQPDQPAGSVTFLPRIRLTTPPKTPRLTPTVPPP